MNDSELRHLFHRLREEERATWVPLPRERERVAGGRVRAWALALVMIATAIGIAALLHRRPPVAESIVTWKAPTDVLLRTPGSELLTTVPRIPDFPERK